VSVANRGASMQCRGSKPWPQPRRMRSTR
jgi:hypothetical protein